MRTAIDAAGRVVIPKALRDELRLTGGEALEAVVRDGRVELEPIGVPMRLERHPTGLERCGASMPFVD